MKCPVCCFPDTKVKDSRSFRSGKSVKRKRECIKCGKKFITMECMENEMLLVIKQNGDRVPFDREKLLRSIVIALRKRPVSLKVMNNIADEVIRDIILKGDIEVKSSDIGDYVMNILRKTDKVGYIRFISVHKSFKNIDDFLRIIDDIVI